MSSQSPDALHLTAVRRRDRGERVVVDALTGLGARSRDLGLRLARRAAVLAPGAERSRVARHAEQSFEHAELFEDRAASLLARLGDGLLLGVSGSDFSALAAFAEASGATVTASLDHAGGPAGRLLLADVAEEGAAVVRKLTVLAAVSHELRLSGDPELEATLREVRDETQASWEALLEQHPGLMSALMGAQTPQLAAA